MPDSLIPDKGPSLLPGSTPPPPPVLPESHIRDFGDHVKTRQNIYGNVLKAAQGIQPVSNVRHTLRLHSPEYIDPDHFSIDQRKQALLTGGTLARRMKGTWELTDNATGALVDRREQVIARVPHLTNMGTFVHGGNDYTLNHQQRLMPGVFTRRKDNGELESHANILPGKGVSHRYLLDPAKGVFKIKIGQAEMPLLPLLKAMGTTDRELYEHWGSELYQSNMLKSEGGVLTKLQNKILSKVDRDNPDEQHRRLALVKKFEDMEVDPEVTKYTLKHPHTRMNKDTILAATKKLLAVSRGEDEVDDRDAPHFQTVLGPEDLISERVARDHGRVQKMLFHKMSMKGHLKDMPSGALTRQIEQTLLGSGLGQAIEEINPAEVFDKQSRITRLGEGGIPSMESVPDDARSVQPGHMGFMDPLRTPESFRVGIDLNMARGARKGGDGRMYSEFRDVRTGRLGWKSPQDLAEAAIAFPGGLASTAKRIPVMKGGKIAYVPRNEVQFELPHFENAFSPLGNMVPLKSMVKGQRVAMASRMLTQALPLTNAEAPLVQSGLPGSGGARSFEEEYGRHLGAVHAGEHGGRVLGISDGGMDVQYADGRKDRVDLYHNFPFNRKTYIHNTPALKPGDTFKAGQLLAKSNYTDHTGAAALGANFRVAYTPWKGYNFEDAQVISETAAKRLSSDHMYHHEVMVDDKHKMGKKNFISLFPGKFDRETLASLDDDGIIKPGTKIEHGQPLILAARENDRADNKVHKKKQAGHNDQSVVWQHHDSGVVTDVVRGKDGPVVLVKSSSQMQVGDKLSGRYGDKGVISAVVPDHQMPHDRNGKPYEILLNPLGVISRTNPAQMVEAQLGKIAALTGKRYKLEDFGSIKDLNQFTIDELRKHGLTSTEDIVDPATGSKIPGVHTGNRFFMKLHHTAESKGQGRGGGGYGMDETPSKGGESGCFTERVFLHTESSGLVSIAEVVQKKLAINVLTKKATGGKLMWMPVVDWFTFAVKPIDIMEVVTDTGRVLEVTRNHEIILADGSRKLAGDLVVGDELQGA